MSTREIITLQFGHYTNYIGAHYWNIQELSFDYTGTIKTECNHDVLYREGKTLKGETTYTPRLLLADLKGSLKTLPSSGGLVDDFQQTENDNCWENIEKIEEPQPPKNEFLKDIDSDNIATEQKVYQLEEDVNTWTDYLYPRLHSRTINVVKEYEQGNENQLFDIYNMGKTVWKSDYGETFSDSIRKYVEECDSMQGFQVNFDCIDGFAGLALSCIEHLRDEYSKTILSYPIIPSYFADNNASNPDEREKSTLKDTARLINTVLSIEELSQHVDIFAPLCTSEKGWRKPGNPRQFEHLNYNTEKYYHSSAILAAAMDTLSLKYRQKNSMFTMSDICADMTGYGRKMVATSLSLPFAMQESKYLIELLNEQTKPLYTCITPSCKIASDKIFQLITVRGIPESYMKAPMKDAKNQMNIPAYRCTSLKEMFELYFQANNFLSPTNITISEKPLELKAPFPRIFSDTLNKFGFIDSINSEVTETVPVMAGYHNGTFMSDMLEKLHREAGRIKFSKLHRFREEGLESSEFEETLDRIAEFKENYEDDYAL